MVLMCYTDHKYRGLLQSPIPTMYENMQEIALQFVSTIPVPCHKNHNNRANPKRFYLTDVSHQQTPIDWDSYEICKMGHHNDHIYHRNQESEKPTVLMILRTCGKQVYRMELI